MALRELELDKAVESAMRRPPQVSGVSVAGLQESPIELDVSTLVSLVAGRNGAGKSTLLQAAAAQLGAMDLSFRDLGVAYEGISAERGSQDEDTDQAGTIRAYFLELSEAVSSISRWMATVPNFGDLLEGIGSSLMADDLRHLAGYILGRDYDAIEVREVTGVTGDDRVVPFFGVMVQDVYYDSHSMGKGDLCLLHLIWQITQLPSSSILFLEEPESHLASFSQSRLVKCLCWVSRTRGIQFVVTTHSPAIALELQAAAITYVNRLPDWEIVQGEAASAVARRLGFVRHGTTLLVLEARVSQYMCRELIARLDPALLMFCSFFTHDDGESGLRSVASRLKTPAFSLDKIVVVYDGDQRSKLREGQLCLPGSDAPDAVLRTLWNTERHRLSTSVRERIDNESLQGMETHDWFMRFSDQVGGYQASMEILVDLVLGDEALQRDARHLVDELRGILVS